tara:strand:+ start:265 stop:480 length:216 start_codon:yes stop_codon:yes gene_type:complete
MSLSPKELEEFRSDVAHALLSKMSKGSQFQFALDRMLQLIAEKTEEELCEMAPPVVVKQPPKNKKKGGTGF